MQPQSYATPMPVETVPLIHPTAIVHPGAKLGIGVRVGPFAVIEDNVTIGPGTVIEAYSLVRGHCIVGANCRIGPAAYVGMDPHHRGYRGGTENWAIIGDECVIRENASVHRAFNPGKEKATRLGNRIYMMDGAHVGHDSIVEDDVTFANGAKLGGHVHVAQGVFLGGNCGIHQFCQIGRNAIVAAHELITHDIPPFAAARYGGLKAYNAVGCRRGGISREGIASIREAYRIIHSVRTTPEVVKAICAIRPQTPEIQDMLSFFVKSKRGIQPSIHLLDRSGAASESDD